MSLATLKRYGKRIVGYEESVPVVSVADWAAPYLNDPAKRVRGLSSYLFRPSDEGGSSRTTSLTCFPSLHGYQDIVCVEIIFSNGQLMFSIDLGWLTGDLIAGVTVGIVVVPQGMSYAQVRLLLTTL